MTRLERKNWTLKMIGYKSSGGLLDLVDNMIKEIYRINDEEFDYICEIADDATIDLMTTEEITFTQKRQILTFLRENVYNR